MSVASGGVSTAIESVKAETVRFELGGAECEIDLTKKNANALRTGVAPDALHVVGWPAAF